MIKGILPVAAAELDLTNMKVRKEAQSRFHKSEDSATHATVKIQPGEIAFDNVNKKLIIRFKDGQTMFINTNVLP